MAVKTTATFDGFIEGDALAIEIARKAVFWAQARQTKHRQWSEVRDYVFATDTTTTSNASLPWRNKTTRPKLCQIRDNLHANYMSALFPTESWFRWLGSDMESATADKAKAIEAYMQTKLRDMRFKEAMSRALYDYIDYGNCFADVEYVIDKTPQLDGELYIQYMGPKTVRISPLDCYFDVTAPNFYDTPKFKRLLVSIGDIHKIAASMTPEDAEPYLKALEKIKRVRSQYMNYDLGDLEKNKALIADGFSSLTNYYESGIIEIGVMEGNFYDAVNDKLYENHRIVIADRAYICENRPLSNWLGKSTMVHAGWRLRPDNLMAMGPLDNLVGMQYRIDHLENLKADVFDMIAFPIIKQKGFVEDWVYAPNERIFMNEDAEVEHLAPDVTALNADMQIRELEEQMEEMAGAPRQAMGIRTPGEKTAFEVDKLENAAGRIFQAKIAQFEDMFVEPLLNHLLECARRNMDGKDTMRVVDDDYGAVTFQTITKEDITARGKLVPMGARHFATQNKLVANLTQLSGTPLYQDPAVNVHLSGYKMARLIVDALSLGNYDLVSENVRIGEQMETQQMMQAAQEQTLGSGLVDPEVEGSAEVEAPDDLS